MENVQLNPEERKQLKTMLGEMTLCLQRIESEREQMKDIAAAVEDALQIKKKHVNKLARTMFKHDFDNLQQEQEEFEFLYESVVQSSRNDSE
jgi:pantothenate synthetase